MGILATARTLAERTPAQRNRYVDLLRAVSILVVVLGHWTMAAVTVRDGELVPGHVLVLASWTHPLTWVFQVMPVFFLVGGYANALSWRSARRRDEDYGTWLRARARRLTLPVVPVLLVWFAAGAVALALGVDWRTLRLASTVARTEVLTVSPEDALERAAQLMAEHDVTHLVIVQPHSGHPVGILSALDVAGVLAWAEAK